MHKWLIVLVALVAPSAVEASVFINEIAWMGTDASGTCEWIELYNSGSETVDLTNWTLTIENPGSAKTIAFNEPGSVQYLGIAASGFYLLARKSTTCDPPISTSSVDWHGSFGNGISNDGATLTLRNGDQIIDTVEASAGWSDTIGGTNTVPKKTPQYTGSGWFAGLPTPRATNESSDLPELEDPEDEEESPPTVTVGGTVPQLPVKDPVPKLYISAIPARIVLAGAETPYRAVVYDSFGELRRDASVRWSFGDGGTAESAITRYTYTEPGEYTAAVRASTREGISVLALMPVVVVEHGISIESVSEQGITLRNATSRLADLSSWKIRARRTFTIPEDTVIAPDGTALLPWSVTRLSTSTEPVLLFPNGLPAGG
ncbi:MAG TPA: lamin tail domain-containing protein [Candidatus Paceibacterota bacterium]|nr:lamin tail domain-containing protein [Candidatus Paceibacterota bacterium]